jgi:hypothetical protein
MTGLTPEEREALIRDANAAWDNGAVSVGAMVEASLPTVERIKAAAAEQARAEVVGCRHAELPDTLWARLRTAESELERLGHGCGNTPPGSGGERCRLYVGHDGNHSDGRGTEWSGGTPDLRAALAAEPTP